jgi:hypothetical protein
MLRWCESLHTHAGADGTICGCGAGDGRWRRLPEGATAMFPVQVDPGWYDKYWLSEVPKPKRRPFGRHLARFAVLAALLAGGGVVLSEFHADHDGSGYQDWEQE